LIYVDPTDYLQLLIYYLGTFEPHCMPYLRACAINGATVIDVGANIGVYTLESAAAVGPAGRVISIEPAPSNARALERNIKLNQMTNVVLIEAAAGDETGWATLSLPSRGNAGMLSLAPLCGEKSYTVEVRLIDDVLEEKGITSVDLIKIDIEGSEYRALRGTVKMLQRCRPVILIELNENALRSCGSSGYEVKELLRGLGYHGWVIGWKAPRPIRSSQLIHDCDECLFVHRDNRSLMQKLRLPDSEIIDNFMTGRCKCE
jgi:FkbM family methyltransferase